jgi:hypothetical protein
MMKTLIPVALAILAMGWNVSIFSEALDVLRELELVEECQMSSNEGLNPPLHLIHNLENNVVAQRRELFHSTLVLSNRLSTS